MGYKEIKGKCKFCLGCSLLEDENFNGTDTCIWSSTPFEEIKKILGVKSKNDNKDTFTMQK